MVSRRCVVARTSTALALLAVGCVVTTGGPARAATGEPTAYAFRSLGPDGRPTRWNPCDTIDYKVNLGSAADRTTALADVQEGVRRVAQATGLRFAYTGASTYVPSTSSTPPADADLFVAYANSSESDLVSGDTVGAGGLDVLRRAYNAQGGATFEAVRGSVVLSSTMLSPPGTEGNASYVGRVHVVMHELGHAVGLEHVSDPDQVMIASTAGFRGRSAEFGAGDLNGLRQVGSANGCIYPDAGHADAPAPGPSPVTGSTPSARPSATPTPTVLTPSGSPTAAPGSDGDCDYVDDAGNTVVYDCPAPSSPRPGVGSSPTPTPSAAGPSSGPPSSGHAVPAVSVAPAQVRYGQTANVTITGTPGATVDLYTRLYPNSSFSRIRSGLLLDSRGRTTVATRPNLNLRFLARDVALAGRDSSTAGADGLMTVQKDVSLSVRRTAVRTYRFSGTLAPAHPGAVVTLYRDGRAVAATRAAADGTYAISTTLASGASAFQARVPASGYNAASSSSAIQVRVS